MVLGAVHVVVRGAVDDRVRPHARHRRRHRPIVGDVERVAAERHHLVASLALAQDRGPQLTAGADDDNPHQAGLSSTPSQRATTTVAMQLPITLTAVRPMSMI